MTVLCFAVRNHTALVFVTVLAVASLVPMAQQGHAAGTAGHNAAIASLGLHLVFAAVWLGGLLTIVLLRGELDRRAGSPIVLARYSTVALICFIVVALSGYASAALRIGTWDELRHALRRARDREGAGAHRARPVRRGAAPLPDRADAATDLGRTAPRRRIRRP